MKVPVSMSTASNRLDQSHSRLVRGNAAVAMAPSARFEKWVLHQIAVNAHLTVHDSSNNNKNKIFSQARAPISLACSQRVIDKLWRWTVKLRGCGTGRAYCLIYRLGTA